MARAGDSGKRGRFDARCGSSALATYVPPRILTNADLEKMVDTSDEWILQRTGISRAAHRRSRGRDLGPGEGSGARAPIERAGITPDDIGFIVVGTTTPDTMFPSTACLLQHKIGATQRVGVRPGRGVLGIHLCAGDRRADRRDRRARSRRWWSVRT